MDTAITTNIYWSNVKVRRGDTVLKLADIHSLIADGRGFVAGSFAAYMMSPIDEPIIPNDIDVFATSDKAYWQMRDQLFSQKWELESQSLIASTFRRSKYLKRWPINLIMPDPAWKDFPGDILNSFDFDVCRALLIDKAHVLADDNAGLLKAKILRMRDPLRTMRRVQKYMARGVEFSDHELLKLFQAWEQLEPNRKKALLDIAREADAPVDSSDWRWDDGDYYEGE